MSGTAGTLKIEVRLRQAQAFLEALPIPGLSLQPAPGKRATELLTDVGVDRAAIRKEAQRSLRESQSRDQVP